MNRLLERTFENRGYSADFFDDILSCEHSVPLYTDKMCEILSSFHKSQELIVLLTDFDFDGINAGVVGFAGMAELGFNVSLYLPDVTKGYGFDADTIQDIVSQYPDVKCIVTGDVGIGAYRGIAYAKALGLTVLVTDHHKGSGSDLADVVVDPQREEDTDSYAYICGANVMYQILRYYAEHYMPMCGHYMEQIDRLRVFVGFGTISDSMPLYHENRPMVLDAIHICRMIYGDGVSNFTDYVTGCDIYRRVFVGLSVLLSAFAEAGKICMNADIDESFIGFYLAPMFNSIKRMGSDVAYAYNIFFGGKSAAEQCVAFLFELNQKRKELVALKFAELSEWNQPWAPFVYLTDAPGGICGLLAQNVLSVTGLPAIVVHSEGDRYVGSGRCPSWFPFLDIGLFPACGWSAGGHNPAFGFCADDDAALDRLFAFLEDKTDTLRPSDEELAFRPDFVISEFGDGDADLDIDLLSNYVYAVDACRPFGSGFPEPVCEFHFAPSSCKWTVIGSDKSHLKLLFSNGVSILAFFQSEKVGALIDHESWEVCTDDLPSRIIMVGKWSFHVFHDVKTLQFTGTLENLGEDYMLQEGEDD